MICDRCHNYVVPTWSEFQMEKILLFLLGNKTEVCVCKGALVCVCVRAHTSVRVCTRVRASVCMCVEASGSQVFWDIFEYISIFKQDRYAWIFLNWGRAQQRRRERDREKRERERKAIFCTDVNLVLTSINRITLLMLSSLSFSMYILARWAHVGVKDGGSQLTN